MERHRLYLALLLAVAALGGLVWSYRHFVAKPALAPQQAYELQREELEAIARSTVDPGVVKPKYQLPPGFVRPSLNVNPHTDATSEGR
ncbi:MAG: hypothetical protein RMK92_01670 [Armatimonadota bacterium]|nr:hypothetical protein [Armatimonadota bacterium]MDW8103693.1 hypothetical protein [Armatimonadota bacterium]